MTENIYHDAQRASKVIKRQTLQAQKEIYMPQLDRELTKRNAKKNA